MAKLKTAVPPHAIDLYRDARSRELHGAHAIATQELTTAPRTPFLRAVLVMHAAIDHATVAAVAQPIRTAVRQRRPACAIRKLNIAGEQAMIRADDLVLAALADHSILASRSATHAHR
jgi:hypothetical protein